MRKLKNNGQTNFKRKIIKRESIDKIIIKKTKFLREVTDKQKEKE